MARRICLTLTESQARFATNCAVTQAVLRKSRGQRETSLSEVHMNVKCILMSENRRLTVRKLLIVYEKLCYSRLPYKDFGFRTAYEMLLTFTDIFTLEKGEAKEEEEEDDHVIILKDLVKESHIYKLVSAQKVPIPTCVPFPDEKKYRTSIPVIPFSAQDVIRVIMWENSQGLRSGVFYTQLKQIVPLEFWEIDIGPQKLVESIPHVVKIVDDVVLPVCPLNIKEVLELRVFYKTQYIAPLLRIDKMEKEIGRNIEQLVEEDLEIPIEDVTFKYMKRFKKELKYKQLGFRNLREFLTVIPGKFRMQYCEESYVLKPNSNSSERDHTSDIRCQGTESSCFRNSWNVLMNDIVNLLKNIPEGVNLNYFPIIYEDTYLRKMIIRSPLRMFFEDLQNHKVLKVVEEEGNFIAKPYFAHSVQKPRSGSVVRPQPLCKLKDKIADLSDVYQNIPDLPLNEPLIFEVTYLDSPNCVYVSTNNCVDEDPHYDLQDVIDKKLGDFYRKNYNEYIVQDIHSLQVGMPVAFCWKGKWHRGKVLESAYAKNNKVKVYAVDTGETVYLAFNVLCYLFKKFISSIPHAVKAVIADEQLMSTILSGCDIFKACIVDRKDGVIYLQ